MNELPPFEDQRVQTVYQLIASDELPPDPAEHWEGWVARRIVAAIEAHEARRAVPHKIPVPPAQAEMLDVVYAEGWNQCCDTFFGGLPPQEPVVITITERDEAPAPQASVVKQVHQYRKEHCADWYDGFPDHEDGGGPYETRTLYTNPAPVREPLTGTVITASPNSEVRNCTFRGITKDTP